jgi:glutamate racemase
MRERAIGFLDSGIGGLSVLKEVRKILPQESVKYFADTKRQPYGSKNRKQIEAHVLQIIKFLLKQGIKACVIACNTATAAGLERAKAHFDIPIVGVIKPGAEAAVKETKKGIIGVIATEFTIKSKIYQKEIKKITPHVKIFTNYCPEFTPLVEAGKFDDLQAYQIVKEYLNPLKRAKIDTLLLGCTHYPFLYKVISETMGPEVKLIDPAINTARVLKEELKIRGLLKKNGNPTDIYYTTGSLRKVKKITEILIGTQNITILKINLEEIG